MARGPNPLKSGMPVKNRRDGKTPGLGIGRRGGRHLKGLPPGWPPREFSQIDPAVGRGYRIGNKVPVPAGAGFSPAIQPVTLANHGLADVISRWKVTLGVSDPDGNDSPRLGSRLRFVVLSKMENDDIPRRCTVSLNDAQVIYAPGRSVQVLAFNPMPFALEGQFSLDEVTAGLSRWEDVEFFEDITAETDMDIPPFCAGFTIYTQTGAAGAIIRGYNDLSATPIYQDTVAVPKSAFLDRIPGLDYTIAPTAGASTRYAVYYTCDG